MRNKRDEQREEAKERGRKVETVKERKIAFDRVFRASMIRVDFPLRIPSRTSRAVDHPRRTSREIATILGLPWTTNDCRFTPNRGSAGFTREIIRDFARARSSSAVTVAASTLRSWPYFWERRPLNATALALRY